MHLKYSCEYGFQDTSAPTQVSCPVVATAPAAAATTTEKALMQGPRARAFSLFEKHTARGDARDRVLETISLASRHKNRSNDSARVIHHNQKNKKKVKDGRSIWFVHNTLKAGPEDYCAFVRKRGWVWLKCKI